MRFLPRILFLALLGSSLGARGLRAAEAMAWRVGRDDFVNYRITVLERRDSQLDGYARWGEIDDVAGFLGYELDREGRRVERAVTHPQLLYVPFVFSLPAGASRGSRLVFDEVLGGTWRLEPFRAKGKLVVTDGRKETGSTSVRMTGEVSFADEPRKGAASAYRQLEEGHLGWTATFDLARGLVTEVEYDLSWTTTAATERRPRGVHALRSGARLFRARIRLDLDRVLAYRYPGFQRDVDRAIDQGVAFLESRQQPDGSWGGRRAFGETALALLALLDGGRGPESPSIQRGFSWLLVQTPWVPGRYPSRTYSIGIALMALERLRTPEVEIERRRRGLASPFLPRRLEGVERAWMMRCAGFLLDTARVHDRTDPSKPVTGGVVDELWRWRYPREVGGKDLIPAPDNGDWDNSNTQYAVLGLESAARCGMPVPRRVWFGVANHFLAVQAPDGPPAKDLRIERQRLEEEEHPRSDTEHVYAPERERARLRGWGYGEMRNPEPVETVGGRPYGSMTTAGIASLAIARSRIEAIEGGRRFTTFLAEIDQAILDGFASLDRMFTVWNNPNYEGWYTYYLYGLERAGMLTGVKRFGGHDWYWEGAIQLLLRQSSYGQSVPEHWVYDLGDVGTTCWAILFLKRGTPPVVTPR